VLGRWQCGFSPQTEVSSLFRVRRVFDECSTEVRSQIRRCRRGLGGPRKAVRRTCDERLLGAFGHLLSDRPPLEIPKREGSRPRRCALHDACDGVI
jgi:hypothetical protein